MTDRADNPPPQRPQARPEVRQIKAYERGAPPVALALDDNTSAFGAPPAALRVLRAARDADISRYPSPYSRTLREAVAQYAGVTPDAVIVGCGSDDILDCALRTFGAPGGRLAYMDPTFVMARLFGLTNGLVPVPVSLTPGFDANVQGFESADAPVTYLCSPNNPTGTPVSAEAVTGVLRTGRGLVILDEAYAEFAGTSWTRATASNERLLVLRTFSKAFGMAGLRVGYGVGNPSLIAEIEKVRGPYKVNAPGEQAALAALVEDTAWVREHAAMTVQLRERFAAALTTRGMHPLPSVANFVLLPVSDAPAIAMALRERQIAVRAFTALSDLGDAIRITIRTWDVMERVLMALEDVW